MSWAALIGIDGVGEVLASDPGDAIIDVNRQSVRLHQAIPGSELYVLPNDGHMVHHHAPLTIVQSIDKLAASARSPQAPVFAQEKPVSLRGMPAPRRFQIGAPVMSTSFV